MNGRTTADLKLSGTTPVAREVFMMSVIDGSSVSRHSVKRKPGRGSRSQVLMAVLVMSRLTYL
jgi:hypothetical protein